MATATQLKALRKKHHLGEFRNKRKVYKHKRIHNRMVRHRKATRRRTRSSSRGFKGVWGSMLGVGVYVLFETYVEKMIPLNEPVLTFAELGVSYWMSKKGGIVGDIGKAGMIINIYQLGKFYLGNMGLATTPTSNVTSMFAY